MTGQSGQSWESENNVSLLKFPDRPVVGLTVNPVPVRPAGVLEVRPGPGDDHLHHDVDDGVEGLRVPVPAH